MSVEVIGPGSSIGWTFNWADDVRVAAGDLIASSTVVVSPTGELAASSVTAGTTSVACTLSGAVRGKLYRVTNTVTLASGQIVPREIAFSCIPVPA